MVDLFKRSVKDQVYDFIKSRHWTRTSDIIRWGMDHFSNGAERAARELGQEGKIRRMTDDEKKIVVGKTREEIWVLNG